MAKCTKCNGQGTYPNPKYYSSRADYIMYEPYKKCGICKGSGYVIGDIKDAFNVLRVYKNNPKSITDEEFKKCIEILEKVFE